MSTRRQRLRRVARNWERNRKQNAVSIARDLTVAQQKIELRDEQARLKAEAAARREARQQRH